MIRKTLFGLMAIVALALATTGTASARGGFHGYHGGFYRGGFGWGPGFGGYYGPYGYGYGWGYPLIYRYEGPGGCHLSHQRVRTAKGWRVRTVDVCE